MPIGGIPLAGMPFVGAAQLGQRGRLASARRPGDDHPAASRHLIAVELHQQPRRADHLLDCRCVHHRQVGVVAAAGLVVVGPLARRQPRQLRGRVQPRRLGLVIDEAAPALLGGQRVIATHVVLGVGVRARPAVGDATHPLITTSRLRRPRRRPRTGSR